jgi:hypothetical protein
VTARGRPKARAVARAAFVVVVTVVFFCAVTEGARAHRGAWASHSTSQAGGKPDAQTFEGCVQVFSRRPGTAHRCKHKVFWDRKYSELSSSDRRWLYPTRRCESDDGRDEHGGGLYHGRYQYSLSTAWSAGYTMDPHLVYPHEDDVRTVRWRNRAGSSQWPRCAPW